MPYLLATSLYCRRFRHPFSGDYFLYPQFFQARSPLFLHPPWGARSEIGATNCIFIYNTKLYIAKIYIQVRWFYKAIVLYKTNPYIFIAAVFSEKLETIFKLSSLDHGRHFRRLLPRGARLSAERVCLAQGGQAFVWDGFGDVWHISTAHRPTPPAFSATPSGGCFQI